MVRTIFDILVAVLLGGLFALAFVLCCPMGAEKQTWWDAVCSRCKKGGEVLERTETRLVGISLLVCSYFFILPFPGMVLGSWTAFWLCVFYLPGFLLRLVDRAKAKLSKMGEKKIEVSKGTSKD